MGLGPLRDVGPAIGIWGATTIAEIFDEIRWTFKEEHAEVFEQLYGATPVDTVHMGYSECSVVIPATRLTIATFATLLPGGSNSGASGSRIVMRAGGSRSVLGVSMYDNGLPLFIRPIVNGVQVANGKWLRLEHTYPCPDFDVEFNVRGQRVYGLTFKAHPDTTSKALWSMGNVATGATY